MCVVAENFKKTYGTTTLTLAVHAYRGLGIDAMSWSIFHMYTCKTRLLGMCRVSFGGRGHLPP